jgi:hypothetical protein
MKHSRSRFEMGESASSAHVLVGDFLLEFASLRRVYQEYSYFKILNKFYKTCAEVVPDQSLLSRARKLHADWVVLDLNLIIEIQGDHHFSIVDYGYSDLDEAEKRYAERIFLDKLKKKIIFETDWTVLWVEHTKNNPLTYSRLKNEVLPYL